ncbi:NACHT domain-containing protein [Streptomyces sp. 796.1]|uniref:NACHT domain-containing protein n=1 Tax=Streptomyces sp. 796.1 TaxID=3163029 RepID=UPI0039C96A17
MQGVEAAVLRLATTVVTVLAKSLLAKGAGLVARPVRPGGVLRRPRELTERETDRLVTALERRLADACRAAPEPARHAAATAVADAFDRAGPLDLELLLQLRLEPEALRGHVLRADGARAGSAGPSSPAREGRPGAPAAAGLGEVETALFDRLLDHCCLHLTEYVTALPEFAARSQVDLVRRSGELTDSVADVRRRLGPGPERLAAEFEERYVAFVQQTHSRLQLFGVTLSDAGAEWALDAAYISLTVSDVSLRHDFEFPELPAEAVRVEHALAHTSRLLLRGPAGSGKSTLTQWLATHAARRSFGPELADWNLCVPFVLRLRALVRRAELPLPQDFLSSMGNPLAGAAPEGWVEGLLTSGRALVLVDGVDEVPKALRKRAETWLKHLVLAYPNARYVVTTRPSAVPDGWLAPDGFRSHSLLPMSRDDVQRFVRHWHRAARQEIGGRPSDQTTLDSYEQAMLQAVTDRRELARLSTNPLMCALLCALNRDRRMHLPRARKDLYDAALEMLLVRRDTEREIQAVEGVELTRDEQTLLLQELAYWLIRNGQTQASREEAVALLEDTLAAMPQVRDQGDADQVFRHLLIRSGLLREPEAGAVDFVHRTFQDYLAAKAAVEARDFGLLADKAHDDQWEDVVRMAVGHARPDECARLLRRILRRADRVKKHRHRLNLLAAACLEHAPRLDPAVREDIEGRLEELVPPWDFEEAEELARAGELVLDLLPRNLTDLEEESAAAVVRTLCLIGGPTALGHLRRHRGDQRPMIEVQLSRGWAHFDAEEYVDSVLSHVRGVSFLNVQSGEETAQLHQLPHFKRINVHGSLHAFRDLPHDMTALALINNPHLDDLSPLSRFAQLDDLGLHRCPKVTDLAPLASTGLTGLSLYDTAVKGLEPLRHLPQLTRLNMTPGGELLDLATLPVGPQLTTLRLHGYDEVHLQGIERWPDLQVLAVSGVTRAEELQHLTHLPNLAQLAVDSHPDPDLEALAALENLRNLHLVFCALPRGLAAMPALTNCTHLFLWGCHAPDPIDLAPLRDMPNLTVKVQDTPVINDHLIPPERLIRPRQRPRR